MEIQTSYDIMKITQEWLTNTTKRQLTHLLKNLIMDVEHLQDAYYGQYDSEQEFAENFVSECYGLPDMPIGSLSTGRKHGMMVYRGIIHLITDIVFCNHW